MIKIVLGKKKDFNLGHNLERFRAQDQEEEAYAKK